MNLRAWITRVDAARKDDALLAAGRWHGYLHDEHAVSGAYPAAGRYALGRWKSAVAHEGIIVVASTPERAFDMARLIERAVSDG